MKKFLKDRRVLVGLVAILLCIAGICYAVAITVNPPETEVMETPVSTIMRHSNNTVIYRKESDGSVSEYRTYGDPIFQNSYPLSAMSPDPDPVNPDEWCFHVIYGQNSEKSVEMYVSDMWFAVNGEYYFLPKMSMFLASLNGICDSLTAE